MGLNYGHSGLALERLGGRRAPGRLSSERAEVPTAIAKLVVRFSGNKLAIYLRVLKKKKKRISHPGSHFPPVSSYLLCCYRRNSGRSFLFVL